MKQSRRVQYKTKVKEKATEKTMSCANCKFGSQGSKGAMARFGMEELDVNVLCCRKNPPRHDYGFPAVSEDDWCGEYVESSPLLNMDQYKHEPE